jgi:hypothetical protein
MGIYILAILSYIAAIVTILYTRKGLETAYIEGKQAGLREAIVIAKERGDVAMLVAPPDQPLTIPLVRAQTAHQIEMDLRDQLARV